MRMSRFGEVVVERHPQVVGDTFQRDSCLPGGRLHQPAQVHRRRVTRAAHPAGDRAHPGAEVHLAKPESTPAQWRAMARRTLTATGRAERLLDGLLALAQATAAASVCDTSAVMTCAVAPGTCQLPARRSSGSRRRPTRTAS
jgi:hypothetical protein